MSEIPVFYDIHTTFSEPTRVCVQAWNTTGTSSAHHRFQCFHPISAKILAGAVDNHSMGGYTCDQCDTGGWQLDEVTIKNAKGDGYEITCPDCRIIDYLFIH